MATATKTSKRTSPSKKNAAEQKVATISLPALAEERKDVSTSGQMNQPSSLSDMGRK
jgi:hypothetical protein